MSIAELKKQSQRQRKSPAPPMDAMQAAFTDPRPKVRLPGDDRLVSDFASEIGQHLREGDIYILNGAVVILREGQPRPLDAQTLRTVAETMVICYRQRSYNDQSYQVGITMRDDDARCVLVSPQFQSHIRRVRRINTCRLPVIRADGKLALLPPGHDAESETLTMLGVEYDDAMEPSEAITVITDLLGEVCFADGARSMSVTVAALVGLYAAQLLPEGALRPCYIVTKNAEGAGATTLVMTVVVPVIGSFPTCVKSEDDGETRKALTAAVREARLVIPFDNQKGRLSSAALEAFLSSPQWSDRMLGGNTTFTGPNIATVFVTANGCTVSPDMRRRSLFIELHLSEERAEDRQFRRPLDLPTLLAMRPKILAACWSLVRHWDAQGRPGPSRSHSAFPTYAKIIGGIVEAAGFTCPFETATIAVAADEDGEAMRRLVNAMETTKSYTFAEVVEICQANGCFEGLVGGVGDEVKNTSRVILSKLLGRYDRRLVGQFRYVIDGKGHGRRYRIEPLETVARSHGQQGVSVTTGNNTHTRDCPKDRADRADHVTPEPVEVNASLRF